MIAMLRNEPSPSRRARTILALLPFLFGTSVSAQAPLHGREHIRELLVSLRHSKDRPTRITVYSDSINGADRVTHSMRTALQEQFGDGGKGWVPIAPAWPALKHQGIEWRSAGWDHRVVSRGKLDHGRYGLGGFVSFPRKSKAFASFDAGTGKPSRYTLYYQSGPGAGEAVVTVGSTAHRHTMVEARPADRLVHFHAPQGEALKVHVTSTKARLYGVTLEHDGPGVVVDAATIIGGFTRALLHMNAVQWQQHLAARGTDMVVFWMGRNDAVASGVPFQARRFERDYTKVILSALGKPPRIPCLVLSTLDASHPSGTKSQPNPRIPALAKAQRRVATGAGCAYIDLLGYFGGTGVATRWVERHPPWLDKRGRHLTRAGGNRVGKVVAKSLIAAARR